MTTTSAGFFLGILTPLALDSPAFTTALAFFSSDDPENLKSYAPISPESSLRKDGSGAGDWCELSMAARDNLSCPIVRIDGFDLEAINGHYVKEHSKIVQGRAIYMHESDMFFAYWCDLYS